MDFRFYLSLFLRRFHWFLIVLVLFTAIGVTLARILPTLYIAEARLVVESEQIPGALAASTVQTQATEQLQIIQQRILTRDTLIEMANRLQIYAPVGGTTYPRMNADEIVEDIKSRIQIVTTGGTVARGPAQATLVAVSFQAPTAALAAAVTNDVVTLILNEDVSMRTGVARQTLEFFEQEVARLDQDLVARSAAILEFKEANLGALPDSLEFRRNQQAAGQERIVQIERAEAELRDRRDRLVRLHEATGAANDTDASAQQTPEARDLQALKDERARQGAVLSAENPRIKILDAQIASLQVIVDAQASGGGDVNAQGVPLSAFDIQLAELEGQMKYLDDQRTQITAEMAALESSITATPGNAITLDTLERDYANVRAQYDQAVGNKAKAETGDTIETLSKGQRISVIEQAVAPREPASPNRPLIAAGGFGAGLVFGLALVALMEFLKGGIRRPAELTQHLGITAFATLPYMRTKAEILRRRMMIWGTISAVAVVVPALLWLVHTQYMPLDLMIEQLRERLTLISGPRPVFA